MVFIDKIDNFVQNICFIKKSPEIRGFSISAIKELVIRNNSGTVAEQNHTSLSRV